MWCACGEQEPAVGRRGDSECSGKLKLDVLQRWPVWVRLYRLRVEALRETTTRAECSSS